MLKTKQLFTYFLVFFLVLNFSCKKTDKILQIENLNTNSSNEEKFFNSNRTADPKEKVLIDYLRRINAKEKFVEKTVAKIGYPRWDKMIKKPIGNIDTNIQNSLEDSSQTFYIPFVRDSQNFVNASMIIEMSSRDTSFGYKCDWQYKFTQNNITNEIDSAEYLATFFMALDRVVFNHKKFKINDSSLFKTNNGAVSYLTFDSLANVNSLVNNLYQYVEFCENVYVWYPACGYPNSEECREGCDLCYLCWARTSSQVCWGDWVNIGGSPPGGGGGGGNGGSTPPDCGVVPVDPLTMGRVIDPCNEGPGWTPIPIEPIESLFDYSHLDNPIFVGDDPVEMPDGFQFAISNFDIQTPTPIKVIGRILPRGNTEDMEYGNNCDANNILSNMPNFTDAQLFAEVEDLFHKTSTGALEGVGDVMIERFRNSLGGQFTNATLSQTVFENSKFQNFIVKFGKELHLALATNNWDINQVPAIVMPQADRPVFNGLHNKFNGLQILINDTEETIIELTNFSINTTTLKWTADINITIIDHFGLDKNDALTYQDKHAGFAAWWILQHCRGYKPFETKVSFKMQLKAE
jgi:hypothetical protein